MENTRWEQVQTLFHDALSLPEGERQSFLSASGASADVIAEIFAMLRADAQSSPLLDGGLPGVAQDFLEAPPSWAAQQEFGPYRLQHLLGEGGMGVVWLAERKDAGNLVAIKFLPHAGFSPARLERFTQEIRLLARLNHPLIARLYDAGTLNDGTPWFVMEYVEGVAITEFCATHNLDFEDRLRLLRSVCEAVQYAHGQEIIHRDLKPSNILVKTDGSPRLLDFGIARQIQNLDETSLGETPLGENSDQTRPGLRFMSPDYAAPEWIDNGDVGFHTDVYSLGVILYQLLAGCLPKKSETATGKENTHTATSPTPPSIAVRGTHAAGTIYKQLSRAAWKDLDVLCLTAMHKDPDRRYRSVEAFIRDIDHFLKHEPLEARPDSISYRLGKFIVRNRTLVAASSMLLTLFAGLAITFTVRLAVEKNRASRESAIATSMNRFLADDLLAQVNPFQSGAAHESFVDAVDRASSDIDRQFSTEPVIAARLHQTIARAFDGRSDYLRARREFDRAHELFLRGQGPHSPDAVIAQVQRADVDARSGDPGALAEAQSSLKDAEAAAAQIVPPDPEVAVRILYTGGIIELAQGNITAANQNFGDALKLALKLPSFDPATLLKIKHRLAFTYIRMSEGAKAESLFRELISDSSNSGYAELNTIFRINLAQALLIERKYSEAIDEANAIYPVLVAKLGEDHDISIKVLGFRAAAEGSLGRWDDAIRDDLTAYNLVARKQGQNSQLALETLSDAALSQCRAGHITEGTANSRKAYEAARQTSDKNAGITGGAGYSLATCLIAANQLKEATSLLDKIDIPAVEHLSGDPTIGPSIELARAEIAVKQSDYAGASRSLEKAGQAFDRPDADAANRELFLRIRDDIASHAKLDR
jgi:eukaryotic-like serine/threonine-protein kinase